jgi:hypothetical protein
VTDIPGGITTPGDTVAKLMDDPELMAGVQAASGRARPS